ncbi:MAG: hypothetical protein HN737_08270 [Desulfobacterales bacterium]|jgi:hypothetical protein|nr:hypothetical protein [Desulfobacterales bacterium]MBT7697390.1 hypothetical protein [Desulfobacterales bacterium]
MTISLSGNIDSPNSRYLVFTSAGDNANLHYWLKGYRNFDLWVSYYGDKKNNYEDHSDFFMAKKGGKFPALHYAYQHWENILNHYHAILVMDDDIIIDGSGISRLFDIRDQYDLWLLQPAFDRRGKISHPITQVNPFTSMRYTNFVEVTCPLFRKDKLDAFMKVYDPVLVGWGIDWWYLDSLKPDIKGKVAIVDKISCINPYDWMKGGQREIDLLQDMPTRIKNWKSIKEQHHISEEQGTVEFDFIKNPFSFSNVIRAITIYSINVAYKFVKNNQKLNKTLRMVAISLCSEVAGELDLYAVERITMNLLRNLLKLMLPSRMRRPLRAAYRKFIFWRAMKQFLKDPESCTYPENSVLNDLIYGWGNESWVALDEYLASCINQALTLSGSILECGSGLSTILIGVIANNRGQSLWVLEHKPEWATKVQRYIDRYKLNSVVMCTKSLKDYGDFCWYEVPLESMPESFSLVICDGPPGGIKGGRYGLVPIMNTRLKKGCVILLDDAFREQELAIARRWEAELGSHFEVLGSSKYFIKMTVM